MSAEPLPADIMEWMGMDESMVEFALDLAPESASTAAQSAR
ncbi:hypothetical protein [Nocardioides dokdonensis]|nr:hypothetical protein [Nocardioides dokdonensis]